MNNSSTENNIKEKVYSNDGNPKVVELIRETSQIILDAGCGQGDNAALLKKMGHTVDGVTISENELKIASAHLRHGFIFNLENGLPVEIKQQQYDYVICSHVLEHICYPQALLKDILHVLKPKGKLIVVLPNLMHYKSRLKLMFGNFEYQEAGIWDYTHFRWYTFKSAAKMLENAGFTLQTKTTTGDLPFGRIFGMLMGQSTREKCSVPLRKIAPGFFGYELLYVAMKT